MYFAARRGGFKYQARLLQLVKDRVVLVFEADDLRAQARAAMVSWKEIGVLMEQYKDLPMDFADASLVAASESLRTRTIFTLDRKDFSIYRAYDGGTFEIVP